MIYAVPEPVQTVIVEPARSNTVRDPQIADLEEYTAAVQAGSRAALELFIARHPDSAYAPEAKKKLDALKD